MARREEIADGSKQAAAEVRKIYAELAARPITRNCTLVTECCQFKLTGKTPHLTKGEALVAAQAVKASGRRTLAVRKDGACPLLDPFTSRCIIYASRPFGCRTHFCAAAGGPYSRREVADLIQRLEIINEGLDGVEARPLAPAIQEILNLR
ncbi:MAG: YkgJ family cysteine cluster protein [Terrimicrobiaceae bacterium]